MVTVKRLKLSDFTEKSKRYFASEVEARARLRHPSLVRLIAYCNQCKERILVYEYMENNSLDFYISGTDASRLDWPKRLEIIETIAQGVAHLHEENVIHGDLQPRNILLDNEWVAKIADFGTAKLLGVDQMRPGQTIEVSPGHAAPEAEQPGEMALKRDVYSFGVIILETLSGQRNGRNQGLIPQIRGLHEHQYLAFLGQTLPLPVPEPQLLLMLQQFIEIGLQCVHQQPGDRPAMSTVVNMLADTHH